MSWSLEPDKDELIENATVEAKAAADRAVKVMEKELAKILMMFLKTKGGAREWAGENSVYVGAAAALREFNDVRLKEAMKHMKSEDPKVDSKVEIASEMLVQAALVKAIVEGIEKIKGE